MHLIVGIDPGTTTGIAVLNFKGKLVHLFSSKDFGLDKVIGHLIPLGKVSLVATDVNPAPYFVSKLVTKLGSRLFLPEEPLLISEKIELTRGYNTKNSHERDALSAAINAFNKFRNKFEKIDLLGYTDDVKHMVLQGLSIETAIEQLKGEDAAPPKQEIHQPVIEVSEEERKIRSLEKQNARLRGIISEKDGDIKRLRRVIFEIKKGYSFKLRKIKKSTEDRSMERYFENTIKSLNERLKYIDKLTELWQMVTKGEIIPVGIFPDATSGVALLKRRLKDSDLEGIKNIDIALVENSSDRIYLEEKGIITADPAYVRELAGCFYITSADLNKIKELKKVSLDRIVENYRKERIS